MALVLQDKALATKFQILVEIAASQPNIRQKDIASKLSVSPQAISEYIEKLAKDTLVISDGRSKYRVTTEGVNWVLKTLRELENYAAFVKKAVTNITICTAAALLGAPLMHDFACISLSDRLTSWQVVALRLRMAAEGNFVIVLYNPKSSGRQRQLAEARKILLQYRSGSTPVGIVDSAFREGQKVTMTDLEHMLDFDVGMFTTIVVGNSTTFTFEQWMVTPRGYEAKYALGSETWQ